MKVALAIGEIEVPSEFQPLFERTDDGVVKYPAPILRKKAVPVARITPETHQLIDYMIHVMRSARGIGLAAPQVGVSQRIIVIEPPDKPLRVILNPQILERSAEQVLGEEGCLSIPALYGQVRRPKSIVIRGLNRHGKPIRLVLDELPARIVLHEVDHLDGVLFIDRVIPETLVWKDPNAPEEEEL